MHQGSTNRFPHRGFLIQNDPRAHEGRIKPYQSTDGVNPPENPQIPSTSTGAK
jgi:hypothetical protein